MDESTNSEQESEVPLEEYKEDMEDISVISYPEINLKDSLAHLHTQEKKISYEFYFIFNFMLRIF